MYKIEKKEFGYKLTFGGFILKEEMKNWLMESKEILETQTETFQIFVDMRTLKPLPAESQEFMQEGQKLYKQKGMERSVVILNDKITTMQFIRIAKETGIYKWERYIDASSNYNWELKGLAWLQNSVDPEKNEDRVFAY